ncbi:hypothetical protein C0995_002971 [Termitomyces sp. Mi166|nr:hypothetical protein C0995_002971 [Termitomyces sp. Mi166\
MGLKPLKALKKGLKTLQNEVKAKEEHLQAQLASWKPISPEDEAWLDHGTSLIESYANDITIQWSTEIEAWKKDQKKPPKDQQARNPSYLLLKVNPFYHYIFSSLLAHGLHTRQVLKVKANKIWQHSQDYQHTKLQVCSTTLQPKIITWSKAQQLYIPGVLALCNVEKHTAARQKTPLKPYTLSLCKFKDCSVHGQHANT